MQFCMSYLRIMLGVLFSTFTFVGYSQLEATNWAISPNSLLYFNGGTFPTVLMNSTSCDFLEASASISDKNGNLLFYTDGDTIKGADNFVFQNGTDISPFSATGVRSGTQGASILRKPGTDSTYYVFSLGMNSTDYKGIFSYSEVNSSVFATNNSVLQSQQVLLADTLSEKITIAKHCNNKDYWVTVIKYWEVVFSNGSVGLPIDHKIEFNSFLITENGIQPSPIKSRIDVNCPIIGQMKVNNAGNELAFAGNNYLTRLAFDNTTGKVTLIDEISLPLENGYGIEYSPNDSLIYINEKQYNIYTGDLVALMDYTCPSQLQRGSDGKIYVNIVPEENIGLSTKESMIYSNVYFLSGIENTTRIIGAISSPNQSGTSSQLVEDAIQINPVERAFHSSLPYFPSFHFNHKPSDFSYQGSCFGSEFIFFLETPISADSVHWLFDEGSLISGDTVSFTFSNSGTYEVFCTTYQNGVVSTSVQCVTVCGFDSPLLPSEIILCEGDSIYVNGLNPCGIDYEWNTGDTISGIWISKIGSYTLTTESECGVYESKLVAISDESCEDELIIPNVITPNNDGINDVFSLELSNVRSINLTVLNRWGQIIHSFSSTFPNPLLNKIEVWDGTTKNGGKVNEGTYFYSIEYTTAKDIQKTKNGFIQVI